VAAIANSRIRTDAGCQQHRPA